MPADAITRTTSKAPAVCVTRSAASPSDDKDAAREAMAQIRENNKKLHDGHFKHGHFVYFERDGKGIANELEALKALGNLKPGEHLTMTTTEYKKLTWTAAIFNDGAIPTLGGEPCNWWRDVDVHELSSLGALPEAWKDLQLLL